MGLAEAFAGRGVPVLLEDPGGTLLFRYAGGDQTGRSPAGTAALSEAAVWRAFSGDGIPFRIPVSDLGPELLARLLGLSGPQEALLAAVFAGADGKGLLLDDAADLGALLAEYGKTHRGQAGMAERIRGRVELFTRGAAGDPFGSPAVTLEDFLSPDGGMLHFLEGTGSGMCLLWLLASCAQNLPLARPGEKPVLAAVLSEDTAKTAAERMQRTLAARGICLIAGTGTGGPVPAALQTGSALRILWNGGEQAKLIFSGQGRRQEAAALPLLADPAPASGGLAGVLERTREQPEFQRLLEKKERNSAREVLAEKAKEQEKEDQKAPAAAGSSRKNSAALREVGRSVAGTVGRQIGEDVGRNFGDFGRRLGGNLGASLGRGILSTLLRR